MVWFKRMTARAWGACVKAVDDCAEVLCGIGVAVCAFGVLLLTSGASVASVVGDYVGEAPRQLYFAIQTYTIPTFGMDMGTLVDDAVSFIGSGFVKIVLAAVGFFTILLLLRFFGVIGKRR